jgi:CRISPR-associated protein Cas6
VQGDRIPADHGYRLYSALVERLPGLKELGWSLKTINGIPDRQGWVQLGSESWLGVRTELANLELFGSLDGQVLRVGKALVQLGTLTGASLQPCPSLEARLVTIKAQYQDQVSPFEFGIALGKALERLGVQAMPVLGERKTLRIKDAAVVGYGVSFADLSPEASLTLQRQGLGGRQRLGCGYFVEKC